MIPPANEPIRLPALAKDAFKPKKTGSDSKATSIGRMASDRFIADHAMEERKASATIRVL